MNKIILSALIVICTTCSAYAKDIQVKGYTKKDGTKVAGYTRHVKDKDTKTTAGATKSDDTKAAEKSQKKTTKN